MTVETIAEKVGYQNVRHFTDYLKEIWNDTCSIP